MPVKSAQPPHNNRPNNQADWLTALMDLVFAKIPEHHLKPKFRADVERSITTKIAEERIKELTLLKTKKVKGANLVELKWVDGRIAELEALKGDKWIK